MFKDKSIQHIFFDLDHTLWDFDTNSKLAITELYSEFNITNLGISLEDFTPVYLRCNEYCWDMYRKNLMKKDLLRHQRFYLALKDFGIIDRPLAKKLGKRYVDLSPTKTALMPGAVEILEYLSPLYSMHIITNGFQEIQSQKMKNSGIEHFFDQIITSEKVGKRKPEPKIFSFALRKTNCEPANAIMIGDNLEADIDGAINSGLHAIWFNHHQYENKKGHHEVNHLSEIKNFL